MLTEREVHADVRAMLMANEPFQYAYLIKFERPSRPDELSGKISTSAHRYTYLTNASRDVVFDDGSKDLNGVANGPQTYLANKVLNVAPISESIEAKANNCSLTLDGNGIGAVATAEVTITAVDAKTWDIDWPDYVDLVSQGFREGDKINLVGDRLGAFNIYKFRANNVLRITKIDDDLIVGTANVSMTLASEEVKSILLNKSLPEYASFINREVVIYRAYFKDGILVGATPDPSGYRGPIFMFRGIINNVSFDDDDNGIKVQWGLTSHWGDFSQVRGRITSDEFHRALDENGNPQPYSAIKPIYAYDKGFSHSDTSINLLATYSVMVDKTTIKAKNGFFGIGAKTKVKTVPVAEGRNTTLDFQLQSKSIPVIYGVRSVPGIPIFADTNKNNSSEVYVVYALSEGQVGGIYDIHLDGKSLICNNAEDFDTRSKQNSEGTIDLVCRGRADRGDVLGGVTSIAATSKNFYYDVADGIDLRDVWNKDFNRNALINYNPYLPPLSNIPASLVGKGVIHGESIKITSPQVITLDFFSGTEGQKAASQLVDMARNNSFKVQNDYWKGNETSEYWGPNHRLIDTAYVVAKIIIKEGETTIPDMEFIVRGKVMPCYNYDYSYAHDDKMTSQSPDNFLLGDTVTLNTNAQPVQIIDKWSFARPDGVIETRFRFSEPPELTYVNGIPTVKRFTMTKGADVWTMITFDWVIHSGTVPSELAAAATIAETAKGVIVSYPSTPDLPVGKEDIQESPLYSFKYGNGKLYRNALLMGDATDTSLETRFR